MERYLMTHSLLSSWLYALKANPYADATTEEDPLDEFMKVLRRESTRQTEAMLNGIEFEDLVTNIVYERADKSHKWYDAANNVAQIIKGGQLQFKAKMSIFGGQWEWLLFGKLDALKAGVIYDIKFSKSYERGKYIGSTQHPTYFEIVPEAQTFVYIVSNGTEVWTESYRRDETLSIFPTIDGFVEWLMATDNLALFKEKWSAL